MTDRNERLSERIKRWMNGLGANVYELRCKTEVIESYDLGELEAPVIDVIRDILEDAEADAEDEGKTRTYTLVGITDGREQHVCPIRLRYRPTKSTVDGMLGTLSKQVTELHQVLMRDRQGETDRLIKVLDTVMGQYSRTVAANERMSDKSEEVFTKLENLRSKELERTILREKHEKDSEIKDRVADALLPLGTAMVKQFTRAPMLPAINLDEQMIIQICLGMNKPQLERIETILGPDLWEHFYAFWEQATAKPPQTNIDVFWKLIDAMNPDQQAAMAGVLNMGQQAALQELWVTRRRQEAAHDNGRN